MVSGELFTKEFDDYNTLLSYGMDNGLFGGGLHSFVIITPEGIKTNVTADERDVIYKWRTEQQAEQAVKIENLAEGIKEKIEGEPK